MDYDGQCPVNYFGMATASIVSLWRQINIFSGSWHEQHTSTHLSGMWAPTCSLSNANYPITVCCTEMLRCLTGQHTLHVPSARVILEIAELYFEWGLKLACFGLTWCHIWDVVFFFFSITHEAIFGGTTVQLWTLFHYDLMDLQVFYLFWVLWPADFRYTSSNSNHNNSTQNLWYQPTLVNKYMFFIPKI